jgi:GT2 family glycosyltransferase
MRDPSVSPAVTVVIVNHNYALFLEDAIDSVLRQTYRDFELVIFDNASSDGSVDIAHRCAAQASDVLVRVIAHNENIGQTRARRACFAASTAQYLLPLDADDKLGVRYLEKTVAALDAHPRAGLAYVDALTFGAENWVHRQEEHSLEEHARKNYFASCTLIRRIAYEAAGGYDPDNWGYFEDWDLWLSIREQGWEAVHVREILLYYRAHRSLSSKHGALHACYTAYVQLRHSSLLRSEENAQSREILRHMPEGWHAKPPVTSPDEIAAQIRAFHPVNRHWHEELARTVQRLGEAGMETNTSFLQNLLGVHYHDYHDTAQSLAAVSPAPAMEIHFFHITDGRDTLHKSHFSVQRQLDQRFRMSILPGMRSWSAAFDSMRMQCETGFFVEMDESTYLLPEAMTIVRAAIAQAPDTVAVLGFHVWDKTLRRAVPAIRAWRKEAALRIRAEAALDVVTCIRQLALAHFHAALLPVILGSRGGYSLGERFFHRVLCRYRSATTMRPRIPSIVRAQFNVFVRDVRETRTPSSASGTLWLLETDDALSWSTE